MRDDSQGLSRRSGEARRRACARLRPAASRPDAGHCELRELREPPAPFRRASRHPPTSSTYLRCPRSSRPQVPLADALAVPLGTPQLRQLICAFSAAGRRQARCPAEEAPRETMRHSRHSRHSRQSRHSPQPPPPRPQVRLADATPSSPAPPPRWRRGRRGPG
jgi:hypothetical protein